MKLFKIKVNKTDYKAANVISMDDICVFVVSRKKLYSSLSGKRASKQRRDFPPLKH